MIIWFEYIETKLTPGLKLIQFDLMLMLIMDESNWLVSTISLVGYVVKIDRGEMFAT